MKKKQKHAWKVVREIEDGKFTSAITSLGNMDYSKKGVWIYPPKDEAQVLFVFRTRKSARVFLKYFSRHLSFHVFKVEIKETVGETYFPTMGMRRASDFNQDFSDTQFVTALKIIKKA